MSEEKPLQKAHTLSAQATTLIYVPITTQTLPQLRQALALTREAADLFLLASSSGGGPGAGGGPPGGGGHAADDAAQRTLGLLVEQHRRQARDLERRIAGLDAQAVAEAKRGDARPGPKVSSAPGRQAVGGSATTPDAGASTAGARTLHRRSTSSSAAPAQTIGGLGPNSPPMSLGLAAAGLGLGHTPSPFAASAAGHPTSPGVARALPFARPPMAYHASSAPGLGLVGHPTPGPGSIAPPPPVSPPALSPLYSSASSSSPSQSPSASRSFGAPQAEGESFTHLGAGPGLGLGSGLGAGDPFSRFWGMLENMLESWNGPVVFASAPLGLDATGSGPGAGAQAGEAGGRKTSQGAERGERSREVEEGRRRAGGAGVLKSKERQQIKSRPDESFYIIPPASTSSGPPSSLSTASASAPQAATSTVTSNSDQPHPPSHPGNAAPAPKTPEELGLENTSLRASLDAISKHAAGVEMTNRRLLETLKEWERARREMTVGLRREAQKVKQGQEMLRSQLMASTAALSPPMAVTSQTPSRGTTMGRTRTVQATQDAGTGDAPLKAGFAGPGGAETGEIGQLKKRVKELEEQLKVSEAEREKQKVQLDKYRERFEKLKASARAKKEAKAAAGGDES